MARVPLLLHRTLWAHLSLTSLMTMVPWRRISSGAPGALYIACSASQEGAWTCLFPSLAGLWENRARVDPAFLSLQLALNIRGPI